MANKTTPESGQETKSEANIGRTPLKKEITTEKERNREKSKDYRERMKGYGYKRVLVWVPRDDRIKKKMRKAGFRWGAAWEKRDQKEERTKIKVSAAIRETSIEVVKEYPKVEEVLSRAINEFCCGITGINDFPYRSLCDDFKELLKPLGDSESKTQTEQLPSKCGEGMNRPKPDSKGLLGTCRTDTPISQ